MGRTEQGNYNRNDRHNQNWNGKEREFIKMQEDYRTVTPPEEGLKALEETIQKAKRDSRKKKKILIIRNIGLGMAAAFAAVLLLANFNADISYAMEKVPVVGQVIEVVIGECIDKGEEKVTYRAEIEEQSVEETKRKAEDEAVETAENEVKIIVEKETNRIIKEWKEDFQSQKGLEDEEVSYEILTNTEDWLAVRFYIEDMESYEVEFDTRKKEPDSSRKKSSGTKKMYFMQKENEKYYNLDWNKGKTIKSLGELFKKDSDYITPISEAIKKQMRAEMKKDEKKTYYLDLKSESSQQEFDKIKEDQSFYMNQDGNLVIVFEENEVAPESVGVVLFEIPGEEIEGILQ